MVYPYFGKQNGDPGENWSATKLLSIPLSL